MYTRYRVCNPPTDFAEDHPMTIKAKRLDILNHKNELYSPRARILDDLQHGNLYCSRELSDLTTGLFCPIERFDTNTSLEGLEAKEDYDSPADLSLTFPINEEDCSDEFPDLSDEIKPCVASASSSGSIDGA